MERAHFILPILVLALPLQGASAGLRNVSRCRLPLQFQITLHSPLPSMPHVSNRACSALASINSHSIVLDQFHLSSDCATMISLLFPTTFSKALLLLCCTPCHQKRARCVPCPNCRWYFICSLRWRLTFRQTAVASCRYRTDVPLLRQRAME